MLNNGGLNWAQVGWWESPYGHRYTFVQWTPTVGRAQTHFYSSLPEGQSSYYTVLYNNTPGQFTFQAGGNTVDRESASFTPNGAQEFGEINTLASQMPGAFYAPEDFSNTELVGVWCMAGIQRGALQ